MKTIFALFTLKPHGENLCSLKARIWLCLLRCSVLLIAGCEAIAWGYIGYLMAGSSHPWAAVLAAVGVGGAVGSLIGGLDAAFVMVDLSKTRRLAPEVSNAPFSYLRWFLTVVRRNATKAHLGAVVRMVMVAVSLTITAPFLAQLIFSRDIAARQQQANNSAIAAARSSLSNSLQEKIVLLTSERDRLQESRSREIAGLGPSGRYGSGPVAESMAQHVYGLNDQIQIAKKEAEDQLQAFDHADPRELARKHHLNLTADGIVARFESLKEMEKSSQSFRWTENAFRVLLAGFFFGLIIFKWYEPQALEIYFDEELQGAFEDFLAGRYDDLLVDLRPHSSREVSPFWFADWYYSTAKLRKETRLLKEKLAAATARVSGFEAAVNQLAGDSIAKMEALQGRRAELQRELEPLQIAVAMEKEQAERLAVEVSRCEAELADTAVLSFSSSSEARAVLAMKKQWEERLQATKVQQRDRALSLAQVERQHAAKTGQLQEIETVIEATGRILAEIMDRITDARLRAIRNLGEIQQA